MASISTVVFSLLIVRGRCDSCFEQYANNSFEFPYYYLLIFLALIFIASIKYFIDLKQSKQIYVNSIKTGIKQYFMLLFRFRTMYGLIFTQLLDQVSDISVINQLYYLSVEEEKEYENTQEDICPRLVHIFSIFFSFVFHRALSCHRSHYV